MSDRTAKTKETMVTKHGGIEGYKAYLREIASEGGKKKVLKGWSKRYADIEAGKKVKPLKAVHKSK